MCLDAGADGVLFSTIEDVEVAKQMVQYCNYPSFGGKRGSALVRENRWGRDKMSNRKPIVIGQIETKTAVDNIEELVKCGFDKFVIGPYDLSASLGCTAEWTNSTYVEYLNKIYSSIPSERLGAFLPSLNDIKVFQDSKRERPSLLIWGLDVNYIIEGINKLKIN
jgi:2-keto-3-deoxy-L-rhamnonate aldolase RhmA